MSDLTYLMNEICVGIEIYYSGRTGGQYLKTAFILCDDYSELMSKLFLLRDDKTWSDRSSSGGFKNYHAVQGDVEDVFKRKRASQLSRLQDLHKNMKERRDRRNDFFHSTSLLDLSVTQRNCVDAFCDLLDYGGLLFGAEWQKELCDARNMETLAVMLRIERKSFSDPSVSSKVLKVLANWPRNIKNSAKKGVNLAVFPEDLHFILCVIHGGKALRDALSALL